MTTWRLPKVPGAVDRVIPASETVAHLLGLRHHFGIDEIADLSDLGPWGIPVHAVTRSRSRSLSATHAGKGLTREDSMASALAEAIEVDCAERFRPADIVRGTYRELRDRHPLARPLTGVPGGRGVPDDVTLDWVWVDDLLAPASERRVRLPLEFLRQGRLNGALFDVNMSNGLASGNVIEEAMVHALDELIERDATAIFTFRGKYCHEPIRQVYRRVDLSTLPPRAAEIARRIATKSKRVRLLDVTSDVGIATVLCWVPNVGTGAGTSLDPERAVIRAMTEAIQTGTLGLQNRREDLDVATRHPRYHPPDFGLRARAIRAAFIDAATREVDFEELPSLTTPFVDADLEKTLDRLREVGVKHVYACDLSDEHCVRFRVVRLVAPDLEAIRLDTIGPRRLRYAL